MKKLLKWLVMLVFLFPCLFLFYGCFVWQGRLSLRPKQVNCQGAPHGRRPFGVAAKERYEHLLKLVEVYKD